MRAIKLYKTEVPNPFRVGHYTHSGWNFCHRQFTIYMFYSDQTKKGWNYKITTFAGDPNIKAHEIYFCRGASYKNREAVVESAIDWIDSRIFKSADYLMKRVGN